ncbi:MAG TPA: lyase family protein, partial [Bacillota bacterium]|nr:lyase family protein [Bacillota bacterium]
MNHNNYESPLSGRYASPEMQRIFSPDEKFTTWRRLWVALAEAERELGLPITDEQIEELRAHIDDIDYELAAKYEREVRHDVMAHVKAYGDVCPTAKGIIHLGATSCYVGDNTDIIIMRRAMLRIRKLLISCIAALADLAEAHKATPALAWTHFQAAQPTTAGKRVAIWIQDLMMDLEALDFQISSLKMLGCRGTTGTAAS